MPSNIRKTIGSVIAAAIFFCAVYTCNAAPEKGKVADDERCSVCGMFVAKYDAWITQIRDQQGRVYYFDGVKDMLAYLLDPKAYGGRPSEELEEVWVKDYYTMQWIPGREAVYVIGSDVYGPMGYEFIAFSSVVPAQSFMKDHKGKRIVTFGEITPELVSSMRTGQRMR